MNIKIKAAGVTCLVGEDYSRVYATLVKSLGPLGAELFTERVPGHEYLQWELPGEGWTSLGEADPLMAAEVREQLVQRKQEVADRFASNRLMAQRVLSVPDDSFVYYRPKPDGGIEIRLTAWGYRYPERIMGMDLGTARNIEQKETVTICCIYDGKPAAEEEIRLNGFAKKTNAEGVYEIGELPVGYQFDIEGRDKNLHVVVTPGQGTITFDLGSPEPEPELEPEVVPPVEEPEPLIEEPEPPVVVPEQPVIEEEPPVTPEPPAEPESKLAQKDKLSWWWLLLILLLMAIATFFACKAILF